jgi:NAD(P)-dependent dehydrogenase (short-subunit alcohol dehydrogenase family)
VKSIDLFRLDGKVILVSGGAGILGTALSRGLAEAGATVVIASRNLQASERFAAELRSEGLAVFAEACDFASETDIAALRDRLLRRHSKIDVLFNNAVARAGGELFGTTAADWSSVMELNSTGLFLSCRLFGEAMIRQKSGSIVNVASIYGMVGPDFSIYEGTPVHNSASYAFAKGGMINFTRYLASYLAPHGIRVNTLSPGGVLTAQTPPKFVENYSRKVPLHRMANGQDLAGAAIFLASEASAYVTGQNIAVDGGWTAT